MSEELKYDRVSGPAGEWRVSTIRTLAGGGGNNKPIGSPFSEADYLNETPWPFETMVFRNNGTTGRYHAPHPTKKAALADHARLVQLIKDGQFVEGVGVEGVWGNPTATRENWRASAETEEESMTQVPEAITARLQEIEDNIARAREQQQRDATQADHLKAAIADRRRGIRGWKLQRDALRYAVDAIEGRVIYAGTVEATPTEPFVERVVEHRRRPRRNEDHVSAKEKVLEAIDRCGLTTFTEIATAAGIDYHGVGAMLGRLRKEGKAVRTEEGLWGPAHQ